MEFRLTYEGPLKSSKRQVRESQRDLRAEHKHEIRRHFHKQLHRLWQTNPLLREGQPVTWQTVQPPPLPPGASYTGGAPAGVSTWVTHGATYTEFLSGRHAIGGFDFIPLVRADLSLISRLDILLLRPEPPGTIVVSGDIDNRLKTLFDALRIPTGANELTAQLHPQLDETPFYCLLEDDAVITHVSVETDLLLDMPAASNDDWVRLLIKVSLRPYHLNPGNRDFG